jgi:hypothetical protein
MLILVHLGNKETTIHKDRHSNVTIQHLPRLDIVTIISVRLTVLRHQLASTIPAVLIQDTT